MRRLRSTSAVIGLLAAVLGPYGFAADIETQLEAVTVFGEGAMITRLGQVSLAAGDNSLKIVDLPPDLDEAHVRVSLASGEGELGQVRITTVERAKRAAYQRSTRLANRRATQPREV